MQGLPLVVMLGLLVVGASLVSKDGPLGAQTSGLAAHGLCSCDSQA